MVVWFFICYIKIYKVNYGNNCRESEIEFSILLVSSTFDWFNSDILEYDNRSVSL